MSGFAPDPGKLVRSPVRTPRKGLVGDAKRALIRHLRDERDAAAVALREANIALDAAVDCKTCLDQGRDVPGPGHQNFGCPGCGLTTGDVR